MTVRDELHALVDRLSDHDADEALDYLRARTERATHPSQAFVDECQAALDEARAPTAVNVPHDAVRAWLRTWGTPEEAAADAAMEALEERLRRDSPGNAD